MITVQSKYCTDDIKQKKSSFWFLFQYIHNGHDTLSDSFTLVARTRTKTSVPAAVLVQVLPVNDQLPILVNNTKLEMWAGATVVITNDILGKIVLVKEVQNFC